MSALPTTELDRDGWCTLPLLGADDVARLRAAFDAITGAERFGFFASHAQLAPAPRRALADTVLDVVGPALAAVWPEAHPFAAALVSKPATAGTRLAYHQDLTYSDERSMRSYVCWVPLVDLDDPADDAGGLRAVAGSHRWATGIRPGGPNAMPTEHLQEELDALATFVPARAGEAVVWDAATIHGSRPNGRDRARPVATVALLPHPAPLTYFHRDRDTDVVEGYAIDTTFFDAPKPFVDRPQGFGPAPVWAPAVVPADLERHLDRHRGVRP